MQINRKQRDELNNLSLELFGSSSRWQKMVNNGSFRITVDRKELDGAKNYVQFQRGVHDKRPGTVMTLDKARNRGVEQENTKVYKNVTRLPTFEEVKAGLQKSLEMSLMSRMTAEELSAVLAYDLVLERLEYRFQLNTKDAKPEEIEQLIGKCPEKVQDVLKNSIKTADNDVSGIPLDTVTFLSDVIFALNHRDAARDLYEKSFSEAKTRKPKATEQQGG